MLKNNKGKLIISSLIILLPILFGLIVWDKMPERVPMHWGMNGEPDGWGSRAVAVFATPAFLLAIHWICLFGTSRDPKNRGQNRKVLSLLFWLVPFVSFFASGMMYASALGARVGAVKVAHIFIGIVFFLVGNYLPKCKQNYTIGIKIKWTLENQTNWNATHRATGKIWVAGGILTVISAFLPQGVMPWVMGGVLFLLVLFPLVYSYTFHKKS
ncbi:MAG: SdpI family protein [Clostridia bacterium]|nr:SdpI family protein [Clostridia bacterium]